MNAKGIIGIVVVLAVLAAIPFYFGKKDDYSPSDYTGFEPSAGGEVFESTSSSGTNTGGSTASPSVEAPASQFQSQTQTQSQAQPAPANEVVEVDISGFAFVPSNLIVKKGTRVVFTNMDQAPHTVTSDVGAGPGGLDSGTLQNGDTYSFTFSQTGTYRYHCAIHPSMRAAITVTE